MIHDIVKMYNFYLISFLWDFSLISVLGAVESFYKRFYFRPRKMGALALDMLKDKQVFKRQMREGYEFFRFLWARENAA